MATTRHPLTRDRILQAALELVDERGLEALTMRRLGQQLGFEAMSLYNYVANKEDVIDGMLELVLAEAELPRTVDDWASAVRETAISVHAALQRHRWAGGQLIAYGRVRPARLQYMESLLTQLREGGLPAEAAYVAYHILDAHIFGFSLWEASHTFSEEDVAEMSEVFEKVITPEQFPYLREHGQQHFDEGPHHDANAYELGLDLIIDGLKKMHDGA
jgi:AcrR family transcriptional regulator